MRILRRVLVLTLAVCAASVACAEMPSLETLLRAQAFNKEFEGFEYYRVVIEADQVQSDGTREVVAVASGRFLEHVQRLKVLFLVVGDQVVGGQILEKNGLPPCVSSSHTSNRSL
ncbi:MAG: hypothetical protein HZB35_10380 [Nitrospirae bacterium]|nr:hypothetical protein [Nitrospirota bacterium]